MCGVILTSTMPAMAADIDVAVTGIRNARGNILVAICDKANFPNGACAYHGEAPARAGSVIIRVPGVPAGIWAAAVYHDETNIRRLDYTLFGMPKQGLGFSRDAKMRFGPPKFTEAAFRVGENRVTVTVPLRYPKP
ncbi:DUF2141 domain-containing protein [Rhodopila globiformis]|uniref:DUF2141 domain-containing protein n=1 Tax=Rhodopila globiformis TaxID=1071 RepID=A0A2S6NKC2_RHOGL|nr:DUF2141 domain-containing protein [Rhodopila globiformis]PPQ35476.1 hypothetical protein CCS01_07285 [Rhodopila globiformis]